MFARLNGCSILLCHVVFPFRAESMLVSGGFASLRFVFAQRDCLAAPMVCQGVGLEVQTYCQEIAFGLLGDCSGTQRLAQGLARDCFAIT